MKISLNRLFLSLTILGAVPSSATALDYVTCESDKDNFRRCSVPRVRDPRNASIWVEKKYSKSSCTEGYSWGVDDHGIWVRHGCRARFAVDSTGYRGRGDHEHDWNSPNRYDHYDNYDGYNSYSPYDQHERTLEELRSERERLERERLELERLRLEKERQELRSPADRCPPGSRPGRCSDSDRRRGCKDWRTATGLGCRTE